MVRKLSAGHLRHRIIIQSRSDASDGRGGNAPTWGTHVTVWARVAPVSAYERLQAGRLEGGVSHKVTLRYTSGVTNAMRVSWGSRTFQIVGVRNPGEDDGILELDCVEERL